MNEIVGHKTIRNEDGTTRHEPLTKEEANSIWAQSVKAEKDRAEKMPDEKSALKQLNDAHQRLRELGWQEAIYCPKDGSMFSAIEAGSTGIHECNYMGEWPNGSWNIYDGDVWPSRPILWRPKKESDPSVNLGPVGIG